MLCLPLYVPQKCCCWCCSEVRVDNTSHEAFTVISLEVQDYPGAPLLLLG